MADTPLVRPAVQSLVPYEPGKPVEEVQRELGLERVVKLAGEAVEPLQTRASLNAERINSLVA